jgi:hypothetical protein
MLRPREAAVADTPSAVQGSCPGRRPPWSIMRSCRQSRNLPPGCLSTATASRMPPSPCTARASSEGCMASCKAWLHLHCLHILRFPPCVQQLQLQRHCLPSVRQHTKPRTDFLHRGGIEEVTRQVEAAGFKLNTAGGQIKVSNMLRRVVRHAAYLYVSVHMPASLVTIPAVFPSAAAHKLD